MTTTASPRVLIVSHTHWDREWYRTFERFRAKLVDVVDRVLDLVARDPDYRFVLDGQTIVVEDYLEIRPERRAELVAAITDGRIGIGPWYVQPDSLLPSGECHIRNLAMGRRVAQRMGVATSAVAYTPDSFGHPAMFPAILAGFGLGPFVYWRGNGDELDRLGPRWCWVAPDGTELECLHLGEGYFAAGPMAIPGDPRDAAESMRGLAERLAEAADGTALVMNGADHTLPDHTIGEVAEALASMTGWPVRRGLLDDLLTPGMLTPAGPVGLPRFGGDLLGGRVANLLPGVWSARMWIKLAHRRSESALLRRLEPMAAMARGLGLPDEAPTVDRGWRLLLANCAHDSICGCSIDRVHRQMAPRYDAVIESSEATVERITARVSGQDPRGPAPWADDTPIAVFNPAPRPRTVIARVPLDGFPLYGLGVGRHETHPLAAATLLHGGFTVDGRPARLVPREDADRVRMVPEQVPADVEFPVEVPAFGWTRVQLAPGPASPDEVDDGRLVEADEGAVRVEVATDGTLSVQLGDRSWVGLFGVEDEGDVGDTYDADPEPDRVVTRPVHVEVERRRHPVGIRELLVRRTFEVPSASGVDGRADATSEVRVTLRVTVADGLGHVPVEVEVDNAAEDHRLRLAFPTGRPTTSVRAATTLGVAERATAPAAAEGWVHPPPATFPHQGWITAGGLCIAAPGLPEAEARPDGTVLITLLRSVGWLSKPVLRTRPVAAGPGPATPEAQCPGVLRASIALLPEGSEHLVEDLEATPCAVPAGADPLVEAGRPGIEVVPDTLVVSTLAPDPDGSGVVLRLSNPGDGSVEAEVRLGAWADRFTGTLSVRLDGSPDGGEVVQSPASRRFVVPACGHRTVLLVPEGT